jgi:hypothetical protein
MGSGFIRDQIGAPENAIGIIHCLQLPAAVHLSLSSGDRLQTARHFPHLLRAGDGEWKKDLAIDEMKKTATLRARREGQSLPRKQDAQAGRMYLRES